MAEIDRVPSWIYYRNVEHMDWIIGIVVPEETIFHNGRMLNTIILAVMLLALLAIYFFCRRTIKDTTIPVTAHQAAIDRAICEGNEACMFVTMFVGVLNLTTGRLDYCNAGHEPPLLTGEPLPVKRNLPVGALVEWEFESQQVQLQTGDMLFLFTDGLSEAKNHDKQLLGRRHVIQIAKQHTKITAQQLVELMEEEVHRHAADAEQSDDITLLAIKWNNCPSSIIHDPLTMRASMDDMVLLQPYIEDVARKAGFDTKESKRLRLAVEEAVANVINYGQASAITLQAMVADNQLTLTIDDDGQPFDPTKGSATDLSIPPDQRPEGGMGIILLQTMTDGQSYQRTDGHNVLTLIKKMKKPQILASRW